MLVVKAGAALLVRAVFILNEIERNLKIYTFYRTKEMSDTVISVQAAS